MGHAMGIMHTQNRPDRETYVIYRNECTIPDEYYQSQFEMLTQGVNTFELPYECDSIMHYARNTFKSSRKLCSFPHGKQRFCHLQSCIGINRLFTSLQIAYYD